MTNEEIQTKSQLLLALGVGYKLCSPEHQDAIFAAAEKVTLELTDHINR